MAIKVTKWDKVFSNLIRERDGWSCQRCMSKFNPDDSSRRGLHCSHYYGRGDWQTRLEPYNAMALCYGCHRYVGSNPIEHTNLWELKFSSEERQIITDLRAGKNRIPKRLIQSEENYLRLKQLLLVYKKARK